MIHKKSIGCMLRASMGLRLLGRPKKKEAQDRRCRSEPTKNPSMLKLVFSLELRNSNSINGETYLNLIWLSPFIVSFGVVTCLVTPPTWVEVRRFKLNFYNCYWKLRT